jgi:hypothetical protein
MVGGLGPVPIDVGAIVFIDRRFGLGPKIHLSDGRWVITTPEGLAGLEQLKPELTSL